ncbi:hypothetical protein WKK05_01210 [Nostoc sp. UHCC 0302]|uniref:hypothetical protein n=1 Tax=Nostoc sp. UHCC 0302 TaxID=3134896 RepID=UPI00311CDC03
MNIRRVLAVVAIPFVIGTFNFVAPSQANAANPLNRNTQISQQPNRPHEQVQRHDEKPQFRRQKPRPHQKKLSSKPHNQGVVQNRVEHNNR